MVSLLDKHAIATRSSPRLFLRRVREQGRPARFFFWLWWEKTREAPALVRRLLGGLIHCVELPEKPLAAIRHTFIHDLAVHHP
jgi:hypothetical protein